MCSPHWSKLADSAAPPRRKPANSLRTRSRANGSRVDREAARTLGGGWLRRGAVGWRACRRCRHDPPRAPPAPGLLEGYAAQFDDQFASVAQRRALREYLHGLLLPRERNKTLAGLAGTEPALGAQAPPAQRLQWFLSEPA